MVTIRKERRDLGKFLARARIRAGHTQRDVSEELGYDTPQFVSNWERGASMPPMSKAIADAIGINYRTFIKRIFKCMHDELQADLRSALASRAAS